MIYRFGCWVRDLFVVLADVAHLLVSRCAYCERRIMPHNHIVLTFENEREEFIRMSSHKKCANQAEKILRRQAQQLISQSRVV